MTRKRRQKSKSIVKELADAVEECRISTPRPEIDIVFRDEIPIETLAFWPMPRLKVPAIFLHIPCPGSEVLRNVKRLMGLNKCVVKSKTKYLKLIPETLQNHQFLVDVLQRRMMPFNTFGYPHNRMMKVVVRNLPVGTDLGLVKEHLIKASVPVQEIHRLRTPQFKTHKTMMVLIVVPNNLEGRKMLRVTHIFNHEVTLEPAQNKTRQCHRCQQWGHAQKYCFGRVKCVKCADNHFSNMCPKVRGAPAMCVNCEGDHTANYRKCPSCPDSKEYKRNERLKHERAQALQAQMQLLQ